MAADNRLQMGYVCAYVRERLLPAAVAVGACLVLLLATAAPPAAAAVPGRMPTPAELDAYLAAKGSPMAGQGSAFVTSGGAWKVDPRLLVAIAGAESSFGSATCAPFNAWGWGCPNRPFSFTSWADGIDTVAEGLRTNYLAEGLTTVAAIHQKYAPVGASNDPTGLNNNWTINVSRFLLEMGGDPIDVDMDGVAGTLPLGLELQVVAEFDFQAVDQPPAAGDGEDGANDEFELVALSGRPARLELQVRNSGTSAWTAATVRLRRVDVSARLSSAPYAALRDPQVAAGDTGHFVIELAPLGSSGGAVPTLWRLEGPGGPFGAEVAREVRMVVSDLAFGPATVTAPASLAPGQHSAVIVKVQNAGGGSWRRDGDDAVLLGLRAASGPSLASGRWPSATAVATLLQREVPPGEWGSFAFQVTAPAGARGAAVLELAPFQRGGWAVGTPVRISITVG